MGYLEVLTTDTNNFSAQLNVALAREGEDLSFIKLYSALGGGWKEQARATRNSVSQLQKNKIQVCLRVRRAQSGTVPNRNGRRYSLIASWTLRRLCLPSTVMKAQP